MINSWNYLCHTEVLILVPTGPFGVLTQCWSHWWAEGLEQLRWVHPAPSSELSAQLVKPLHTSPVSTHSPLPHWYRWEGHFLWLPETAVRKKSIVIKRWVKHHIVAGHHYTQMLIFTLHKWELLRFGDRHVCLLSNIIEQHGTPLVVLSVPKTFPRAMSFSRNYDQDSQVGNIFCLSLNRREQTFNHRWDASSKYS